MAMIFTTFEDLETRETRNVLLLVSSLQNDNGSASETEYREEDELT